MVTSAARMEGRRADGRASVPPAECLAPLTGVHEANGHAVRLVGIPHRGRSDAFDGQLIVDIGAGSRLRSRYFERARIVAIEPLADRFVSTIKWSDLREAAELQSIPAEQFVEHLAGQAAFVMCINVLDHVFDPDSVVRNAFRYLEPGGDFLLAVDLHAHGEAGHMHPVHVDRAGLRRMLDAAGFSIEREFDGLGPTGANSFGHGQAYTVVARRPSGSSPES